jgi:hypothetical protein
MVTATDRKEEKLYGPEFREGWGEGPWQDEPDQITWTDPESGYPCAIGRQAILGSLFGYVGIPATHPYHDAPEEARNELDAHGGINWSHGHLPWEEEDGPYWWFGFDCAHVGRDLVPQLDFLHQPGQLLAEFANSAGHQGEVYRDVAFVEQEISSLITQLMAYQPS